MIKSNIVDNNNNDRIVLVTVSDLTQPLGEAVSTLSVASSLARDYGFETLILAPRIKSGAPILQPEGVAIKWTFNVRTIGLPNSLNVLPQLIPLARLLFGKRAAHAYIRYNPCAYIPTLLSKALRRGCIVVEHNAWLEDERGGSDRFPFLAKLERILQSATARVASVNRTVIQDNADKLAANGVRPDALIVAPNATDTNLVRPVSRHEAIAAFNLDDHFQYIGFIGTFAYWQDIAILIEAMPKILNRVDNVRLVLAGYGPERLKAERRARELDVDEKVIFLDQVPYLEISKLLSCLDIALLPTKPNFYVTVGRSPMKLYDYAATGRAILAAEIRNMNSYAEEGWLETYRPGDSEDLAEKTVALLNDTERRLKLGQAARMMAERQFSWRRRLKPIVDFISRNGKS